MSDTRPIEAPPVRRSVAVRLLIPAVLVGLGLAVALTALQLWLDERAEPSSLRTLEILAGSAAKTVLGSLAALVLVHRMLMRHMAALSAAAATREARLQQTIRALVASERRHRELVSAIPVGVFEDDVDIGNVFVNSRLVEMTGRAPAELAGDGWPAMVHPDDRALAVDAFRQSVRARAVHRLQFRLRRPDGDVVWVLAQGVPRLADDGSLRGYVGTLTDITALRRDALGQLASGVAHDFNNLLGAVGGFAQLIVADRAADDPAADYAGRILTACRRGTSHVDRILRLAGLKTIAQSPARPADPAPRPALPYRVLLVDDDPIYGDMVHTALERSGFIVMACTEPAEALAAVRARPDAWDAVVTDQVMPGLLGTDLIRAVKAIRPDLPCILCSGCAQALTEAAPDEADVAMRKPVDIADLVRRLRQLCGG